MKQGAAANNCESNTSTHAVPALIYARRRKRLAKRCFWRGLFVLRVVFGVFCSELY